MADRVTIKGAGMVVQSFSLEERSAYTKMINNTLADVEPCKKYLPMDPNSDDVFERLGDGVMLCFLINKAVPGTIDEKKIVTKENMNPFLKGENIKLGLNGAKQIGIKVVGVGTDTFRDYEKEKILLLGIIWQVVKAVILASISLKSYPQLKRLLKENEALPDLEKLTPEDILIRWVNFHLNNAGKPEIKNLGKDVKDAKPYSYLLNQLDKEKCTLDGVEEADEATRAAKAIEDSKKIGAETYIEPADINSGNPNLNLLYTSSIFNAKSGLDIPISKPPQLARVCEENEKFDDLILLPPDEILIKWFNFHLKNAGQEPIKNLEDDVKDGKAYTYLLNQLDPEKCNLDGLNEEDPIKRQQMQIDNSKKLGVDTKATPEALASGHYNSNLEHTAAIYEKVHGLDPKINKGDELKRLVHTGETLDDVKHLPCDELLKRWFNHHLKNAEQPEINNFGDDLKDGKNYTYLLNQLDDEKCNLDPLNDDDAARASKVIDNSNALGVESKIKPEDITNGDAFKNLCHCADLYNKNNGLDPKLNKPDELKRLAHDGETLDDVKNLPSEDLLKRWFNYHLKNAGQPEINNLTDDVKDGKNYTYLLNQLDDEKCNLDSLADEDCNARNQKVIDNAKELGAKTKAKPEELTSGDENANLYHTAAIYNAANGLNPKLKKYPQCSKLLTDGEDLEKFYSQPPEDVLKRWFNYHLKNAGQPEINNLTDDVKDGKNYTHLLNQIDESKCNLDPLNEADDNARNQKVIDNAKTLGAKTYAKPEELSSGNETANLLHTAAIYNAAPGMDPKLKKGDEVKRLAHAGETLDDVKALPTDELLKRWFNHHLKNAEQPEINNFGDDLKDGKNYTYLLNQLDDEKCNLDPLNDDDATRATKVIDNCKTLGVESDIKPEEITSGDPIKNLEHTAAIYNKINGLNPKLNKPDELKRLAHDGETLDDVKNLPEEELLKRWMNYHLKNAGQPEINNFTDDVKDGKNYTYVLNQLDDEKCNLDSLADEDCNVRNQKVIDNAKALGAKTRAKPEELTSGDETANLFHTAAMYNAANGLTPKLKHYPELKKLLNEGEELQNLYSLPPEDLLKRWFNYHLKNAGQPEINNLTDDVKDGKNYTYLLNQLDNEKCNLDPLNEADDNARNQKVIDNAKTLGAKTYAKPEELSSGNETANLLHTAAIYNAIHGLEDKEEPDTPEEASQRKAYAKFINKKLGDVENIQKNLPINPDNGDLYDKVKNGLIVCDLVNKVAPGTIDERCIEVGDDLDDLQKEENVKLGIASAKGVGVKNDEIKPESYLDSKMHKGELLNHLGQLAREIEYVPITLKDHPELIRLLNQDEQISELLKMKPEDILLRWMNHHLKKAGQPEVANLDEALKDGKAYTYLLNQLDGEKCNLDGINDTEDNERNKKVIANSEAIGADVFIEPEDITSGSKPLNLLHVAALMNAKTGLDPPDEKAAMEAAKLMEDDNEGSREERSYRMWVNSLGVTDGNISNLYEECKEAILLLKVLDRVRPGCVDWKVVDEKTKNPFKKGVNCNEAINAAKKNGYHIVGIGGGDVRNGNKKYILAIVWQIMRDHTLQIIGGKSEEELVTWGNALMPEDSLKIKDLKDKSLSTGLWFINICKAIDARAINWNIVVKEPQSDEDKEKNAKYALSVARKLEALVFCVWEDIKEVKSGMLLTLLASLYEVYSKKQ